MLLLCLIIIHCRTTIDRGHSDVKSLNKQLTECDSEIEEHTMKLQLLNKQLQIAQDLLDASKKKQQELKDKVCSALISYKIVVLLTCTLYG